MKQIDYAGGTMLTSDEVADVLLRYAAALAVADQSTTVDAPGVTSDGLPGTFQVLLGPASQLLAEPTLLELDVDSGTFVDEIEREIARLENPRRALPFEGDVPVTDDFFG